MNKIYVGNLSWDITEDELTDFFITFGSIKSVKLISDRETGRLKGFGFIEFDEAGSAQTAVDNANGKELLGRAMKVSIAKERESR